MNRPTAALSLVLVLASASLAAAVGRPLICFGNEPSWSVTLGQSPGRATFSSPDEAPVEYAGVETSLAPMAERVWRGKPPAGGGGDLVVFLRDATCSDGMSDVRHPVTARVSLADGRFLAGCCRIPSSESATPPAPPAAASSAETIEDVEWRLERSGSTVSTGSALPSDATLRLSGRDLQLFGGCNRLGGSYTIDGAKITVGDLRSTMMACAEPVMAAESALAKALAGAHRFRVSAGRLELDRDAEKTRLVFVAAPAPRLAGTSWDVTGFNNGRQAVVGPVAGSAITVSFDESTVTGSSGCNRFRASYTVSGDRLSVGAASTTRKACGDELMEQERELLAAIASATAWAIDRGMLDVHRGDGERVLLASPRPE